MSGVELPAEPRATGQRRTHLTPSPRRIVVRFALYLALGLAVTAASVLFLVRQSNMSDAEAGASDRTQLLAAAAIPLGLDGGTLARPLDGKRKELLDGLFGRQLKSHAIASAAVYRADGPRLYSIGRGSPRESAALLQEVLQGAMRTTVRNDAHGKRLVVFTPFHRQGSASAVVVIEQDYAPIARDAGEAFRSIVNVLPAALLCLFLVFVPVLRRLAWHVGIQMKLIQHHALHDDLTDLPNRTLMHDRLEQALLQAERSCDGLAVMVLDLDRFKETNDTLGHHAGDVLLQEVSLRLRDAVRASDTVARLGGDEFGVLSTETGDAVAAIGLAERISRAIDAPLRVDGMNLDVESSIGIALYPTHGRTVDELLRHADFAMYAAKQRGTPYEIYVQRDEAESHAEIGLLGDFRRALDEHELLVHYQPSIDMRTGEVSGVEALVRWRHPDHGLLLPSEFIPIVEQTSLIHPLTLAVLDRTLEQGREWLDAGLDLRLAVNLSSRSLQEPQLVEELRALLHRWSISPARLDLEITESAFMTNPQRGMSALTELRGLGVGLVLDDFGTGFSSLTFLRTLPVDKIKIDRSVVEDLAQSGSDGVIVRSLIELAHNLDLEVIAEGVEDGVVWEQLSQLGCDAAQGFHISRARSAGDLASWIEQRSEPPLLYAAV